MMKPINALLVDCFVVQCSISIAAFFVYIQANSFNFTANQSLETKMAAPTQSSFCTNLQQKVEDCKLFVIGAGGIGCELLKNLVLVGFKAISLVSFCNLFSLLPAAIIITRNIGNICMYAEVC